jgi:cell pole-organizing protein PopZ
MSRLEPNGEPSMEEILASIRKIIAEDSSGMRSPSATPRPGTPYTQAARTPNGSASPEQANVPQSSPAPSSPVAAPRGGFMSREAFLKSSRPSEADAKPERFDPRSAIAGLRNVPSSDAPQSPQSPSRLKLRDDARQNGAGSSRLEPAFSRDPFAAGDADGTASNSGRARDSLARAPGGSNTSLDTPGKVPGKSLFSGPRADLGPSDETVVVASEDVEVIAAADALPIIEGARVLGNRDGASGPAKSAEPLSERTSTAEKIDSDSARIDAQLSELLTEDLNALRESRSKSAGGPADAVESRGDKTSIASDPAAPQRAAGDGIAGDKPASNASEADPFAFDLGPSPFAPKMESAPVPLAEAKDEPAAPLPPVESENDRFRQSLNALASSAATSADTDVPKAVSTASVAPVEQPISRPRYATPIGPAHMPEFKASSGRAVEPPRPDLDRLPFAFGGPAFTARPNVEQEPPLAMPPRPAVPSEQPASAAEQNPFVSKSYSPFAIPSVSATLGPSRKLEPLSNAFGPAPVSPPPPPETFSPLPELPPLTFRADPRDEINGAASSNLPATLTGSAIDRPMEDAVADLLRPLLKTWLAENMPKIVERALRREMTERLLPGQKSPND